VKRMLAFMTLIVIAMGFFGCDGSGYNAPVAASIDPVIVGIDASPMAIDTSQMSTVVATAANHEEATLVMRRPGGPIVYSITFTGGEHEFPFYPVAADTGVWEFLVVGVNSDGEDRDSVEVLVTSHQYSSLEHSDGWVASSATAAGADLGNLRVLEDGIFVWCLIDVQPSPVQAFCVSFTQGEWWGWARNNPTDCPIVVPTTPGLHWLKVGLAQTDAGYPLHDGGEIWNVRLWNAERAQASNGFPSTHCSGVWPLEASIRARMIVFERITTF